jgi:hypothetical protein
MEEDTLGEVVKRRKTSSQICNSSVESIGMVKSIINFKLKLILANVATSISQKMETENLAGIVQEMEGEAPRGILFASVIMAINGKDMDFPVGQLFQ